MDRRSFVQTAAASSAGALSSAAQVRPVERKGHLKQSVCRWCYSKIPIEDLARESARLDSKSIDLASKDEWPTLKKYGLVPSMVRGTARTIPDNINDKDLHSQLEPLIRESAIAAAGKNGAPNVIILSGNRKKLSDEEGMANCVTFLKKVIKQAEDANVNLCMELLNSKVNHADYHVRPHQVGR